MSLQRYSYMHRTSPPRRSKFHARRHPLSTRKGLIEELDRADLMNRFNYATDKTD